MPPRGWWLGLGCLGSLAIWFTPFDLASGRHWQVGLFFPLPPCFGSHFRKRLCSWRNTVCPEGCPAWSQHSQASSDTISFLCLQSQGENCLLLLLCSWGLTDLPRRLKPPTASKGIPPFQSLYRLRWTVSCQTPDQYKVHISLFDTLIWVCGKTQTDCGNGWPPRSISIACELCPVKSAL